MCDNEETEAKRYSYLDREDLGNKAHEYQDVLEEYLKEKKINPKDLYDKVIAGNLDWYTLSFDTASFYEANNKQLKEEYENIFWQTYNYIKNMGVANSHTEKILKNSLLDLIELGEDEN